MAKATTKQTETTYVVELSEREARALTELLLAANWDEGEGKRLHDIYDALIEAGVEDDDVYLDDYSFKINNQEVTVFRSEDEDEDEDEDEE